MSRKGKRRPERHLAIMAKAPHPALAKRRLAADIGAVAALSFYRGARQPAALALWLMDADRRPRAAAAAGSRCDRRAAAISGRMRRPLASFRATGRLAQPPPAPAPPAVPAAPFPWRALVEPAGACGHAPHPRSALQG